MTRDEISTLFQEAASIINNTPLYGISPQPDDPLPITPAQLMTLKDSPNPSPIEFFSQKDLETYGINRWRRVQELSEDFWKRWRREYLSNLLSRAKWTKGRRNLRTGDLVLLRDKNLPRNEWKSGVVNLVVTGSDGVVRKCEVKTKSGVFRRAVTDVVVLVPRAPECSGHGA